MWLLFPTDTSIEQAGQLCCKSHYAARCQSPKENKFSRKSNERGSMLYYKWEDNDELAGECIFI